MTRHLLVTLDFPPSAGGVARYYQSLVDAMPSGTVDVLAPRVSAQSMNTPGKARVHRRTLLVRWIWPHWGVVFFQILWYALRGTRSFFAGQVLPIGTALLLVKKILPIRYIVFTHGLDVTIHGSGMRKARLRDTVFAHAQMIVANSEYTKRKIVQTGVPAEKVLIIQPGCSFKGNEADASAMRDVRERYALRSSPVLLTVGRLVRRKGIDTVLTALAAVRSSFPDLQYCIAGDGPEHQALEEQAKRLGLDRHVRFLGPVDEKTLIVLYALCDLFVLTPHHDPRDPEGFGIVFLEANAFGKPVIGSRTGGVAEAIQDGHTGLLVPPDDPQAIADALKTLLGDPQLRFRLGENGKQYVREQCQWSQRVQPFLKKLQVTNYKLPNPKPPFSL